MFYNILLKDHKGRTSTASTNLIEELIDILNKTVMDFFEDSMIVNVVLQLITLFTSKSDNPSLFTHKKILNYVFSRLRLPANKEEPERNPETVKLAALAMSRLSSRFDPEKNTELYIKELKDFDHFEYIMQQIKNIASSNNN